MIPQTNLLCEENSHDPPTHCHATSATNDAIPGERPVEPLEPHSHRKLNSHYRTAAVQGE
jgi:hypothetical protein